MGGTVQAAQAMVLEADTETEPTVLETDTETVQEELPSAWNSRDMCRKTPSFSYGDIRHVHRIYASN